MLARHRVLRLCYVVAMVENLRRNRVLAALFPLLILAVTVLGIQSAHQWLDTPVEAGAGITGAHVHSDHGHAPSVAVGEVGPDSGSGGKDRVPECHELRNPLATTPDRCTARDSDQQLSPNPCPVAVWAFADPPAADSPRMSQHRRPPVASDRLAELCVLRI